MFWFFKFSANLFSPYRCREIEPSLNTAREQDKREYYCCKIIMTANNQVDPHLKVKEVCNGGVACSLEKTVTASLFRSGLHFKQSFFCRKNHTTWPFAFVGDCPFFTWKRLKKNLWCQIDCLIICNIFCSNHFMIRCQTKVLL